MAGLIVVRHNEREPRYRCLCCPDGVFFAGEETAYERHVALCARRNAEEMEGQSMRAKLPGIFDPFRSGDVELERWISRHRGMLLEGRMNL